MAEITPKGNSNTLYTLRMNVTEYGTSPSNAPKPALRRVISYQDDTIPTQVDSERLMEAFRGLRAGDFKYYFYILGHMERNDKAVHCRPTDMLRFFGEKHRSHISQALIRLIQVGLIFRAPRSAGKYIVNPVFAWKGNRLDYLDLSSFEDHT